MANSSAFPALDTSVPSSPTNRANTASPTTSLNGSNGVGAANNPSSASANAAAYLTPLPVGHQQDLNHLYNQIQELSGILRSNRERVNVITKNAEEVARRANGALNADNEDPAAAESDSKLHFYIFRRNFVSKSPPSLKPPTLTEVKIHALELELAKQKKLVDLYKHEQLENTTLIASYEEALGTAVEQIRTYCTGINARFLAQTRHYNDLLQAEKDEHLASRLERDEWHAKTLKVCRMIREAKRLRDGEWFEEYIVVNELQQQVRIMRRLLEWPEEKKEEEVGWPYLKDLPIPDD
jgi:hypothetical protein